MLVFILLICLATDLRKRKIYNIVLLPALLFGLIYSLVIGGWTGLGQSALGLIAGLGVLIIPFAIGAMGAGDVKLLAVIGAIEGPLFLFYTAIGMALMGGAIALLILIYQRQLLETMSNFLRGVRLMVITRLKVIDFSADKERTMFPYSLAIAAGAMGAMWWVR